MPGAVSGADEHDLEPRAQAFARDDLRRRARERDQQPHERVAIGVAQPRQHAAAELATLGARRQRLRELEQRDRRRRGRQPVEIGEHAIGERGANREQQLIGRRCPRAARARARRSARAPRDLVARPTPLVGIASACSPANAARYVLPLPIAPIVRCYEVGVRSAALSVSL